MFIVTYFYSHPTEAHNLPKVTPEQAEFRKNFLTWASTHGLLSLNVDKSNATVSVYKSYWKSEEDYQAFIDHFGQPYQDFVLACKASAEDIGGTVTRTEETNT